MPLPTLADVLAQLAFLTTTPAVAGLVLTTAVLIVVRDWRLSLVALLIQYILAGLLLTRLVRPEIAAVRVFAGALICPILYLSIRSVPWGRSPISPYRQIFPLGWPFRLLSTLLVGLTIYPVPARYPLPNLPPDVNFAVYWLAAMGVLLLALTEEPLKAGLGLLTVLLAGEVFLVTVVSSLSLVGLMWVVDVLVALAIAYLITAGHARPAEETLA